VTLLTFLLETLLLPPAALKIQFRTAMGALRGFGLVASYLVGLDFFFFFLRFNYYVYSILPAYTPAGQKRAPDLITDGCEPPCGCWELNSGPLEEQTVLLTAEPPLQPCDLLFLTQSATLCLFNNESRPFLFKVTVVRCLLTPLILWLSFSLVGVLLFSFFCTSMRGSLFDCLEPDGSLGVVICSDSH